MAIYLNTVKCPESAKTTREKRASKEELEKFIVVATVVVDKEMQRMSKNKQVEAKEANVKEEPVGKSSKKRGKRVSEAEMKERFCFKCGEAGWNYRKRQNVQG